MNQSDLLSIAIPFAIVLVALTIHEAAHAWTADRLGDPTARLLGRVSLNPIVHIDPIGTLLLPLLAAYSGLPIIGWAKPVPVNTSRLRHPQRDFAVIAAAGPISNLLQAAIVGIVLHAIWPAPGVAPAAYGSMGLTVLVQAVQINVLLALFNLIPVPPLDGAGVTGLFVSEATARRLQAWMAQPFVALGGLLVAWLVMGRVFGPVLRAAVDVLYLGT